MKFSGPAAIALGSGFSVPGGVTLSGTVFVIRTGTAPTFAGSAPTGTILATLSEFGTWQAATTVSSNVLVTLLASAGLCYYISAASATGTAGYWRVEDGSGNPLLQGSIGTSGAEINVNSLSITTGQSVAITTFSFTISGLI